MGHDKAACSVAGKPLLAHMLDKLRALGLRTRVAGLRAPVGGVTAEIVADAHPDCGPLSGIETALRESKTDAALLVGVDLPLVSPALLNLLLERAERTGAAATIPRVIGAPQPLCAVYRRVLLEPVSHSLDAGDYKVMRVVMAGAVTVSASIDLFDMESVTAAGQMANWQSSLPPHLQMMNCNTPAELAFVAALLTGGPML